MTKTGIIIQARKGSSRLPQKMVLPFYKDQNVLDIVLQKIKKQYPDRTVVLATTTNKLDDELISIAQKHQIDCYRGSENNVLSRFVEVSDLYQFDNVIRVCADNPFLDVIHIETLIDRIEEKNVDYVSYKNETGTPTIKTHLGLFTEAVSVNALKSVAKKTSENIYLEHVTNYIYTHDYKLDLLPLPKYFENTDNIRLTLDTLEDFELEQKLYPKFKNASTKELITFVKSDKEIQAKMKQQIIKNSK